MRSNQIQLFVQSRFSYLLMQRRFKSLRPNSAKSQTCDEDGEISGSATVGDDRDSGEAREQLNEYFI